MAVAQLCFTCRYGWGFKNEDGDVVNDYGTCRRYAPKPVINGSQASPVCWPVIGLGDGCGDWTTCDL